MSKGHRPGKGDEKIADRGLLYPILGLATASVVTVLHQLVTGTYPDPITIANVCLVGLGIGLIAARAGRLGPFEGVLGSPWQEVRLRETIERESARALRYGRDLTIIAIRPVDDSRLDFRRAIRPTDQHLVCRNKWNLIILPETDDSGALFLLEQICGDQPVLLALVSPDAERPRQRIEEELLEQIRSATRSRVTAFREQKCSEPRLLVS